MLVDPKAVTKQGGSDQEHWVGKEEGKPQPVDVPEEIVPDQEFRQKEEMWHENLDKAIRIQHYICDQVYESRKKDYDNEFRNATFRNEDEKIAVIGKIEDVGFVQQIRQETEDFVALIQKYRNNH